MQMNIPATNGPICFSGSLEEDWNVYGRTTDDERTPSDGNSSHDLLGQVSQKNEDFIAIILQFFTWNKN
jgi:hypothetical protein